MIIYLYVWYVVFTKENLFFENTQKSSQTKNKTIFYSFSCTCNVEHPTHTYTKQNFFFGIGVQLSIWAELNKCVPFNIKCMYCIVCKSVCGFCTIKKMNKGSMPFHSFYAYTYQYIHIYRVSEKRRFQRANLTDQYARSPNELFKHGVWVCVYATWCGELATMVVTVKAIQ